jgi:hypothetical protein
MNEEIDWIHKKVDSLVATPLFRQYFEGIDMEGEDGSYYISNQLCGIELVVNEAKEIRSIHFFGENRKIETCFKGDLPLGIVFSWSREKIQASFGIPKKSGGGHRDIHYGFIPVWDKYLFDTYSLHLEYSKDEKNISLLTIASLSLEVKLNVGLQ